MNKLLNFDLKINFIESVKVFFLLVVLDFNFLIVLLLDYDDYNLRLFIFIILFDFLSLLIFIINKKIKSDWISLIAITVFMPFFRPAFPYIFYCFKYLFGYSNQLFFIIIFIHFLSFIIPILFKDKTEKFSNNINFNKFIFIIAFLIILLIPGKYVTRYSEGFLERNLLVLRAGVGSILLDYLWVWSLFPKSLSFLRKKMVKENV